jgi:chromosome segregation ATPase
MFTSTSINNYPIAELRPHGDATGSPRERKVEEHHGTTTRDKELQRLEHELRRAHGEVQNLNRICKELDHQNRIKHNMIQGLHHELASIQQDKKQSNTSGKAARAILQMTGAGPVMDVVDTILLLHKEIVKISDFLAENIRHSPYELFQEELDRCYRNSEGMVGKKLSNSLQEHSEEEKLSQLFIKITIKIFIVSFCAFEWEPYLDPQATMHGGE